MSQDLNTIFQSIKAELKVYQPPFVSKTDSDLSFDLWSFRDLVIEGRKRKEVYFAAATIHKDYVGFYYMPVYAQPEVKRLIPPELLKLLKGKSCFHIWKLDETLLAQIRSVLKLGYEQYASRGWV
jgi:hypothetical protein